MDELWLERMADVLCCDKDPAAVVVALNELQEQLASAKRMIAQLRSEKSMLQSNGRSRRALSLKARRLIIDDPLNPLVADKEANEIPSRAALSITIPDRVASVSISELDTEICFSGAGLVKIPEGVGVFDVETHLGFKGTIEIRKSEIANGKRRLAGWKFICSEKMPSKPLTEKQIIEALDSTDSINGESK